MSGVELARERDRRRTRYAAVAVAALAVAGTMALVLGPAAPAVAAARLAVVSASVELMPESSTAFTDVSSPIDVATGSVIRTGERGLAEISYGDGSLTRLGPSTTYGLMTLELGPRGREVVGRLGVGQSFHRVTKATGSRSRFEVHTSKAIAAVRGTAFSVQCPIVDRCEVAVTEGVVAVTTPDGKTVEVTSGQRVAIGDDGDLGELEAAPPTDPWLTQNQAPEQDPSAPTTPETVVPTPGPAATANGSTSTTGMAPASSSATGPFRVDATPPGPGLAVPPPTTTTTTATTPPAAGSSTSTSVPLAPAVTLPLGEIPPPLEPSQVCPGDKGQPRRDGCVPCQVGGASTANPNCATGK